VTLPPVPALLTAAVAIGLLAAAVFIEPARRGIGSVPWGLAVIACVTLGLAPFSPPHLFEKLQMLAAGTLIKPLDWFDLALHGTPWMLLIAKVLVAVAEKLGR